MSGLPSSPGSHNHDIEPRKSQPIEVKPLPQQPPPIPAAAFRNPAAVTLTASDIGNTITNALKGSSGGSRPSEKEKSITPGAEENPNGINEQIARRNAEKAREAEKARGRKGPRIDVIPAALAATFVLIASQINLLYSGINDEKLRDANGRALTTEEILRRQKQAERKANGLPPEHTMHCKPTNEEATANENNCADQGRFFAHEEETGAPLCCTKP